MIVSKIDNSESIMELENGNRIYVGEDYSLERTSITFNGSDNILYMDGRCHLSKSQITFDGNGSIAFLSSNSNNYYLNVCLNNNNTFYMGEENYINNSLAIILSEEKHVFFGNDCAISSGVRMRNADPHLIYSVKNHQRINPTKSIYIGNHVWIGQGVFILKGTKVSSGSIIGAGSVVSGKKISANSCWAGNPARCIANDIFWDKHSVHRWTRDKTLKFNEMKTDKYIFKLGGDDELCLFDEIDKNLSSKEKVLDKLDYLLRINRQFKN